MYVNVKVLDALSGKVMVKRNEFKKNEIIYVSRNK